MSAEQRWTLPESWVWAAFGEFSKILGGGTPSNDPSYFGTGGDIPWLTPADLRGYTEPYIAKGKRFLTDVGLRLSGARLLPKDSVLLSSRAPIGYCVIAANPIATSQGFKSLILAGGISPEYIRYYLLSSIDYLESLGSGTTFLELSGSAVAEVSVPIAPIPEQKRIVATLNRLRAESTRARTALSNVATLANRYKRNLLLKAFLGELTGDWRSKNGSAESATDLINRVTSPRQSRGGRAATDLVIPGRAALSVNDPGTPPPPSWRWVPLQRVARQETGHTPSRSRSDWWGGSIPWIGIKDASMHHGGYINDTLQHTNKEGLANSSARLLPKNTVCLSRTASVGYVVILGREMATSQDFVTWTCTEALHPEYLMYALLAEGVDIRRFGKGTTHTTIYFPEIRALHICLPPILEQQEIVQRIKKASAHIDALVNNLTEAMNLIERFDQAALKKAFCGLLLPQHPKDEVAAKWLARTQKGLQSGPVQASMIESHSSLSKNSLSPVETIIVKKTRKDVPSNHLTTILAGKGSVTADRLWRKSGMTIDEFYKQLRGEMRRKAIRETSPNRLKVI